MPPILSPTAAGGGGASQADIDAAIAALVDSSPAALDTLNELAAALGDDPNFATTIATALGGKLAVVEHGATAGTARPAVAGPVLWIGSVVPDNIEVNDILLNPDASGELAAAAITVDDTGWTEISGADVQAVLDSADAAIAAGGGGGGTFVKRAYQSLTALSSFGAANTRQQWGTEEATVNDADLPTLTGVTVYASVRGSSGNWSADCLLRYRVEISLDGGSTWSQGQDNWCRFDAIGANDRITFFTDHQVTGTVTGDIQARVMAEVDVTSGAPQLSFGNIAMEVVV